MAVVAVAWELEAAMEVEAAAVMEEAEVYILINYRQPVCLHTSVYFSNVCLHFLGGGGRGGSFGGRGGGRGGYGDRDRGGRW